MTSTFRLLSLLLATLVAACGGGSLPSEDGNLRLVALEYLALKANWDAHNAAPPSLFGQPFNETGAGNRYGLPAFYSLHAWIWDPNPTDLFFPWNSRVTCP